jgi:hypothetical protein
MQKNDPNIGLWEKTHFSAENCEQNIGRQSWEEVCFFGYVTNFATQREHQQSIIKHFFKFLSDQAVHEQGDQISLWKSRPKMLLNPFFAKINNSL